jgi:predicted branched-subunit amino acid permease
MFPAAFLALLAPQLRRPGAPVAAVAGAMITIVVLPFAPAGVPVVAALAAVVPGVLVARGMTAMSERASQVQVDSPEEVG